ncbi:MAG TPA: hypothetical protein VIU61_17300 [Kofleriaceae bacterium]
MLDARQQKRFAIVRASAAYRRACREDEPDQPWGPDIAKLFLSALLFGGIVFMLAGTGRHSAAFAGVICTIAWLALLVNAIRARSGPLVHRLAIVKSTWTGMSGGSAEMMSVARTLTLVHQDGSEASYDAPNTAAGMVEDGEIGVAITRRRALVRFISLETLAPYRDRTAP